MTRIACALFATFALAACSGKDGGDGASGTGTQAKAVSAEAQQTWDTLCATCHGKEGKGDGPAGAALDPKARNFHDAEWQKSVTDDQIKKVIVEGGPAIGKSPLMTPNPQLKGKEDILNGLVQIIRNMNK